MDTHLHKSQVPDLAFRQCLSRLTSKFTGLHSCC